MFDTQPSKLKKVGESFGFLIPFLIMISILYHLLYRFNIKPLWLSYQITLIIAILVYVVGSIIIYLKNEKRQIIF